MVEWMSGVEGLLVLANIRNRSLGGCKQTAHCFEFRKRVEGRGRGKYGRWEEEEMEDRVMMAMCVRCGRRSLGCFLFFFVFAFLGSQRTWFALT